MSDSQKKQIISSHLWIVYALAAVMVAIVWYFEWIGGLLLSFLLVASFYYTFQKERSSFKKTEEYIATLSHRVEKVGTAALVQMPIGIVLYNDKHEIEWVNPYMRFYGDEDSLLGKSLNILSEDLIPKIKENKNEVWFHLKSYDFQTTIINEERLLYLFDRTRQVEIETLYDSEQTILAIIFLDNYEELTQTMDDTRKSQLNSNITSVLNKW